MNENDFLTYDDRLYLNPQTGLDESNAFIENLRQAQAEDTARINQQTYALGTQVPSNLGGLSGAEATFAERYQKPQTEQMIANLKAAAQQTALNQALENTLAQYKNQYNQAYRNAVKRANTPDTTNEPDNTGLQIDTETGNTNEYEGYINEQIPTVFRVGSIGADENGFPYYQGTGGRRYPISNVTDPIAKNQLSMSAKLGQAPDNTVLYDGLTWTSGRGDKYIYSTYQYPDGAWYKVLGM